MGGQGEAWVGAAGGAGCCRAVQLRASTQQGPARLARLAARSRPTHLQRWHVLEGRLAVQHGPDHQAQGPQVRGPGQHAVVDALGSGVAVVAQGVQGERGQGASTAGACGAGASSGTGGDALEQPQGAAAQRHQVRYRSALHSPEQHPSGAPRTQAPDGAVVAGVHVRLLVPQQPAEPKVAQLAGEAAPVGARACQQHVLRLQVAVHLWRAGARTGGGGCTGWWRECRGRRARRQAAGWRWRGT